MTGDIDYGDDDDLEESARENHVEPKDDRPRVRASLVLKASLSAALIGQLSARAGRRHAHLMGAQAARDAVERFYGADSEEARTVAAPYSTEAAGRRRRRRARTQPRRPRRSGGGNRR